MTRYIAQRLAWMVVTVWGVLTITWVIGFVVPSDPARIIAGVHATPETVAAVARLYGFNQPFYVQYVRFLWDVLHLNVGTSYHFHTSALPLVLGRLGATAELGVFAVLAELLIGVPLGIIAAQRRDTRLDMVISGSLVAGSSMPTYWFGILLIYVVAFKAGILPVGGFGGYGPGGWSYLVLPALTYGITGAAYYGRLLRASLIEVAVQDHVRTARAKGLPARSVLWRHVVRNGLLPLVTQLGIDLANTLSGLIILETVFDWPGVGSLVVQAIDYVDVPLILAATLLASVLVVVLNFVVDLVYLALDPRISYS
jgi:peptide/nickel transport system permease protein